VASLHQRRESRDFIRLDQATDTPRQLFDAMIELYPDRANPGSLWGGANKALRRERLSERRRDGGTKRTKLKLAGGERWMDADDCD
jgi:hypothetical protein